MIFVTFWAIFRSTFPIECYLCLSWGGCVYLSSCCIT